MTERSIIHVGGSPGSGKSRLARAVTDRLTNETGLTAEHISIGDRLRMIGRQALWSTFEEEITLHLTDPARQALPLDDEIVERVVANALSQSDERDVDVVLLDGYPRYFSQVEMYFDLAQLSRRSTPGAIVTDVDPETALVRMLKRGNKNHERLIDIEDAAGRIELHEKSYPLTLLQLGMYASRFEIYTIDTAGSRAQTDDQGFQATLRLLGTRLPEDDAA